MDQQRGPISRAELIIIAAIGIVMFCLIEFTDFGLAWRSMR